MMNNINPVHIKLYTMFDMRLPCAGLAIAGITSKLYI